MIEVTLLRIIEINYWQITSVNCNLTYINLYIQSMYHCLNNIDLFTWQLTSLVHIGSFKEISRQALNQFYSP